MTAQFMVIVLAGCVGLPPDTRDPEPIPDIGPVTPPVPEPVAAREPPPMPEEPMSPPEPKPVEPFAPPAAPTADSLFEQQKRQHAETLMQFERWTGTEAPMDVFRKALKK